MAGKRRTVTVDGTDVSVLANTDGTPHLLLLHGTFWSRVWDGMLPALGESVVAAAPDFPGFGRSGGELHADRAGIPELAAFSLRVADALGMDAFTVAGHDIGGAVAQHLAAHHPDRVRQLVLVNSVLYDSWPVPAVARFREESVRRSTTSPEFREARLAALQRATARRLPEDAQSEYLSPWEDEARIRSWMAMAARADSRYTRELLGALRDGDRPTLLIWGQDDEFQPIDYARRFAADVPPAELVTIPKARHIPMEDDPDRVAGELLAFLEVVTVAEDA